MLKSSNPVVYDDHGSNWDSLSSIGKGLATSAMVVGAFGLMNDDTYHTRGVINVPDLNGTMLPPSDLDTDNHVVRSVWLNDMIMAQNMNLKAYTNSLSVNQVQYIPKFLADKSFVLATKVKSLLSLHHGWDGAGAEPITKEAVDEGLSFVDLLKVYNVMPHVSPAADGELSFSWRNEGAYLEVSFYGDGLMYWYHRTIDTSETGTDSFSRKSIPRKIENIIRGFKS